MNKEALVQLIVKCYGNYVAYSTDTRNENMPVVIADFAEWELQAGSKRYFTLLVML